MANGSTALQQKRSAMSWSGVTVFRGRFLITAPWTKYLKPNWIGSIKEIHVSHSWTTISIIYHKIFCCQCSTCYCNLLREMNILDASIDTNRLLISNILYTLKPLRNAVAHNNIVFDARFKDRNINAVVKKWAEKESGIKNISLYSLIDYIIIIFCLLNRIDFNMKRAKHVFQIYKDQNKILEQSVSSEIYNMLIPPNVVEKLKGLERLIKEN